VPRARRRATAGIGQEWASSGFGGALPVLCEENPAHYHYQEPGRCGTGRFLHIEHFEERSSFSTWHTRIAINSALMISRRRRNFSEIPAKDSGAVGWSQEIADSAPNPEKHYLAQKRERLVQRAIRSLRPNIRGVLEMQHSQDYSVEEIARVMSISVGAVKGRLFHARKALRRAPSLRNIGGSKFRARRTTTRSRTGDG